MNNTQQTLKLALAAATLGATGAQAAIVNSGPEAAGTTNVALPDSGQISLNLFSISGSNLWELDAQASGGANVGFVVSAGTVIGSGTSFASTTNIDKVNQFETPGIVALHNGDGQLLPFEFMDNGHMDYGYLSFDAQATAGGVTRYQIDGFTYDDSGAGVIAGAGAVSSVPEPGSLSMLAAGALGLLAYRRRQHASRA